MRAAMHMLSKRASKPSSLEARILCSWNRTRLNSLPISRSSFYHNNNSFRVMKARKLWRSQGNGHGVGDYQRPGIIVLPS